MVNSVNTYLRNVGNACWYLGAMNRIYVYLMCRQRPSGAASDGRSKTSYKRYCVQRQEQTLRRLTQVN